MSSARILFRLFSLVLLLVASHVIADQSAPLAPATNQGLDTDAVRIIDSVARDLVGQQKVAGMTTLIVRKGHEIYYGEVGYRDLEKRLLIERDTIFRIYSMSKAVTSTAAMLLWEEGKFQLDDAVSKYIPEFEGLRVYVAQSESGEIVTEPLASEVTVRQLFTHTSGLTYVFDPEHPVDSRYRELGVLNYEGATLKDMTAKLTQLPLVYQPGTRWHYSVSIDVLGRLVEIWSGMPLDQFLSQRIFAPLEMTDTGFNVPDDKAHRLAKIYHPDETGMLVEGDMIEHDYTQPNSFHSGGGGLLSTIDDYMNFLQLFLGDGEFRGRRLLKKSTVDLMRTNQVSSQALIGAIHPENRGDLGHGLGFAVVVDPERLSISASAGEYFWGGMANTVYWVDPVEELAVVAMTQYWGNNELPIRESLRSAIGQAFSD